MRPPVFLLGVGMTPVAEHWETSLRELALQAGAVETAMVVGVEKVTDRVGTDLDAALSAWSDADYEAVHGLTATAQAALVMRRYLHEHGAPSDALAGFSITAHRNAVGNANAMYRRAITLEDYRRAGMLSDPVNLYDAAPLAHGAAAILLGRSAVVRMPDRPSLRVLGTAAATSRLAVHDQDDPLILRAAAGSPPETPPA